MSTTEMSIFSRMSKAKFNIVLTRQKSSLENYKYVRGLTESEFYKNVSAHRNVNSFSKLLNYINYGTIVPLLL